MYEQVSLSVRVDGGVSDPFHVPNGVKQGCILSPLLFDIFTKDLPEAFKYCDLVFLGVHPVCCLMYADDTILVPLAAYRRR